VSIHNHDQFILSKRKLPCDGLGKVCNAHDTTKWLGYDTAVTAARALGCGVGFVITEDDPFFLIDIDDCLLSDGTWSGLAQDLCSTFSGCLVEVSQSGRGLHIIGTGRPTVPSSLRRKKYRSADTGEGFDLYTESRYVALTGTGAVGASGVRPSQAVLDGVVDRYLHVDTPVSTTPSGSGPVPEWDGYTDDDELIAAAMRSSSVAAKFGFRATFADLWNANEDVLSGMYPRDNGDGTDLSRCDAALAQHLAFWTGKDTERIHRLLCKSCLLREKYDRPDYLDRTVSTAVNLQKAVHARRPSSPKVEQDSSGPGYQYLDTTKLIEYFKGCVYVRDEHAIFVPSGAFLRPEQFDAVYGGYEFQVTGDGKTKRSAWVAFTQSQVHQFPKVDTTCFRPLLAPGELLTHEGRSMVNTYVPVETSQSDGGVDPFLKHLGLVLPVERDRQIFLAYMAACVQSRGVKFQWAPLLQGVEGNGKSLFTWCVAHCIGEKYTHMPPASEIGEKYNAWIFGKLFIGVEDVYVPRAQNDVIEILKPMITNVRLAKRAMRMDQVMGDVCANFIFNSNHKDAIRKTENDRRFAIFYSAQQSMGDLIRDGMTGPYFPLLYTWLRGGGYDAVHGYLARYNIPEEFNPATSCNRAPQTSSTTAAIRESVCPVGASVLEAVDQDRVGFRGGWVSTMAVIRLLQDDGRRVNYAHLGTLLTSLGYRKHPALIDGRVGKSSVIDGGRTKLYIKVGSDLGEIVKGAVLERYEAAQEV